MRPSPLSCATWEGVTVMLIREIACRPVGPLERPVLFRPEKPCTVIFDENEAGKTAFVDVLVNLLFRRSSARSRFQSRRFTEFDGCVKIEHGGMEIAFGGSVDLDRRLGLPPQFARLPIVRGSDLAVLWSGDRDRKAPLIDACIQHFASDLRENLDTVIKNIRAEAGLTARRNAWSQGALTGIEGFLNLYRCKDLYLKDLAERERLRRMLQEVEGRLAAVRQELQGARQCLRQLEEERNAALCAAGRMLAGKLSELNRLYRDAGYERCTPEDAGLWAEIDVKLDSLREKKLSLQQEMENCEAELQEIRERLEALNINCRDAEAACRSARSALDTAMEEANRRGRLLSNALGELRNAFSTAQAAGARKEKTGWALLAVPVLAVAAILLFYAGLLLPGGVAAAACIGAAVWSAAVSAACRQAEKEAAERAFRLLRDFGVQPPARMDAAVSAFERYCLEEEERLKKEVAGADRACREAEAYHQRLLNEKAALLQKSEVLQTSRQRARTMLQTCGNELAAAEQVRQELMTRTGKPSRSELEKALQEKAAVEKEMTKIKAQLESCLGPAGEWQERLAGLEKYLERYPSPRSMEDLNRLQGEKEAAEKRLKEEEQELQAERDALQQQIFEASRRLVAAGCEDVGALAGRLAEAEGALKAAIRKALAALWAQRVIEAARGSVEDALLEPLARASQIFRYITGRYDSISYTRRDGDLLFQVTGSGRTYGEEVLSDGTKAQFLLALRLALLERFLGGEKGFLVLDDPLLNSSETRKRRAIEVLLDYARNGWQVIYLTVDAAVPDIFKGYGGDLVALKRVRNLYQPPELRNES